MMYKIIKDGTVMAVITAPAWVKLQENNSFTLCDEDSAQGVVIDGTVYHVCGKPELTGYTDISLIYVDQVAYQKEQQAAQQVRQLQTDTALAELSILIANAAAHTADNTGV